MPLKPSTRAYLTVVALAGALSLAWAVHHVLVNPPADRYWLVLLALTCFTSTFSVRVPGVAATISVSETFVFLCAFLYGAAPATIVIALDGLLTSYSRKHRRPEQLLFNATEPALSIFVASLAFAALAGHQVASTHAPEIGHELLPLVAFTLTYFLINSGLNAGIVAQHHGLPFWTTWRSHFGAVLLNYFGSASVAALLVYNSQGFSFTSLAIVVPLLLISYFAFKSSLQRVEDANRHLQQMNRLYLSTIETLAMAVDATDQITHGHIRRVQTWAVGLANALGVSEPQQVKAIEAAALLHDVGKLAIPEHILNKPGRLTPAEFEKIKKHASIGADILSAIDFPYPVVPIVRHHHEHWDGSGYPAGLSGSEIPIGARILSVVDCFDALTSDRPYRRALPDHEALDMLLAERGKSYDPLVVDTFARVYRDIAPTDLESGPRSAALREIKAAAQPALAPPEEPGEFVPDAVPVAATLLSTTDEPGWHGLAENIAGALLRTTPAGLVALYMHDEASSALRVRYASGEHAARIADLGFALGDRLSGWVGAQRRVVCNSDAKLDFVGLEGAALPFSSCLSVPLVAGDALEGVLTLYALGVNTFSDTHRRAVESVARPLAHLLRGLREMVEAERLASAGVAASLDSTDTLRPPSRELHGRPGAAVAVRLSPAGPFVDHQVALVKAGLRAREFVGEAVRVCLDPPSGVLILLPVEGAPLAASLAGHLRDRLAGFRVTLGVAESPQDGPDLAAVIDVARRRALTGVRHEPAGPFGTVLPLRQAGLFEERGQPHSGTA